MDFLCAQIVSLTIQMFCISFSSVFRSTPRILIETPGFIVERVELSAIQFLVERMMTLTIFACKFLYKQHSEPNQSVVLHEPLERVLF